MSNPIPSVSECLVLMDRFEMLENIRQHSFLVARVAEAILDGFDRSASSLVQSPARSLVLAGALLHDIAKTKCLDGSCRHAEEGQIMCDALGYSQVGTIVREHVILSSFTPREYTAGIFEAREIVYYADKRVRHDEIVSLQERLDYIIERYSNGSGYLEQRIRENFDLCFELETYLFSFIDFTPDQLEKQVNPEPFISH